MYPTLVKRKAAKIHWEANKVAGYLARWIARVGADTSRLDNDGALLNTGCLDLSVPDQNAWLQAAAAESIERTATSCCLSLRVVARNGAA